MDILNDIAEVWISADQLQEANRRLGEEITRDYADKNLLVVGILKGSVIFMADLLREIKCPCTIDFMSVSSYGDGSVSTREVKIVNDLTTSLEGKDVLLVEDILDSGNTLAALMRKLSERNPRSLRICTLLDKSARREADVSADYVGFTVDDAFVVGYGLDYAQQYRQLPFIGVLDPKIYE